MRAPLARRLKGAFQRLSVAMRGGEKAEQAAVAAWCTMVGALVLSRIFRGERRADEILRWAQQSILDAESPAIRNA